MTLTQLRYLVAIVDAGLNISAAADQVHAAQPGLSRQIRQLEDELGFLLFTRRGRRLDSITDAGEHVLVHARRMLEEAGNISALAANRRAEQHGQLSLVTTHTQANYVLPPAVTALREAFPKVAVRLQPSAEGEILDRLVQEGDDLAIISTSGAQPAADIAIPLYRWHRILLAPAGHPLTRLDHAPTLTDLAAWPLVSYESSHRVDSSLQRTFTRAGLAMRLAMTAQDADTIKTYARTGIGIGVIAEMAISPKDGDLVVLPAPDALPACITWAVLPKGRVLRDYTVRLLAALAPQIDSIDVRRVIAGNASPDWPEPQWWKK